MLHDRTFGRQDPPFGFGASLRLADDTVVCAGARRGGVYIATLEVEGSVVGLYSRTFGLYANFALADEVIVELHIETLQVNNRTLGVDGSTVEVDEILLAESAVRVRPQQFLVGL